MGHVPLVPPDPKRLRGPESSDASTGCAGVGSFRIDFLLPLREKVAGGAGDRMRAQVRLAGYHRPESVGQTRKTDLLRKLMTTTNDGVHVIRGKQKKPRSDRVDPVAAWL